MTLKKSKINVVYGKIPPAKNYNNRVKNTFINSIQIMIK